MSNEFVNTATTFGQRMLESKEILTEKIETGEIKTTNNKGNGIAEEGDFYKYYRIYVLRKRNFYLGAEERYD